MGILKDIDRIIVESDLDDEERDAPMDIEPKTIVRDEIEDDEEGDQPEVIGDVMKHIESLKKIAVFIDGLTTEQGDTTAFEAEIAIRKALEKMKALGDELYKKNKK